jgi:hypothetical protein
MAHCRKIAAGWLLFIAAWWLAVAWISRQAAPWAIESTDPAFAAGLAWTYVGLWSVAVVQASNRRAMGYRALAVTLSCALGLAILEAPAMAGLMDYSRTRAALTGDWNGPATDFVLDHELSFRRPPGARWSGWPRSNMAQVFNLSVRSAYRQTFSTDARGFRNAAAAGWADIAMIGDSYVEGAYVSDEETVAVRLHELTDREVVNLGVSGYGTLQELKVLERYALPLGPRTVAWFFFEGNDLDDDQSFEDAMAYEHGVPALPKVPQSWPEKWRHFLDRSFTANLFMQLREEADRFVPNNVDSIGWFRDKDGRLRQFLFFDFYATRQLGAFERERFDVTKAAFRHASEICRQRGIRLVLFYVPIKYRVYGDLCAFPKGSRCTQWHPWDLESQFAAFCRDAGIECVSLTEPMRHAAAAGEVLYAPEDSHWSAAGHAFVAKIVKHVVTSNALLQ